MNTYIKKDLAVDYVLDAYDLDDFLYWYSDRELCKYLASHYTEQEMREFIKDYYR